MKNIKKGFNSEYSDIEPTVDDLDDLPEYTIIEFGAPWCGYCQSAQQGLKNVMDKNPGVGHVKVYDGKGKRLGRHFRVKLWPTLILLHKGNEVARVVRPSGEEDIENLLSDTVPM